MSILLGKIVQLFTKQFYYVVDLRKFPQDMYLTATTIKKPKYNYCKVDNKHIKKMYIKKF